MNDKHQEDKASAAPNVVRFPLRTDCLDEASTWLSRVDRGLTTAEEKALDAWLAERPEHLTTFLDLAELWDRMDSLSRLADIFPPPTEQPGPGRLRSFAIAASVLLLLSLGPLLLFRAGDVSGPATNSDPAFVSNSQSLFETAVGEHTEISLPDGSVLTLNTNSRLVTEFDDSERRIHLERGEVHVRVAHDPSRPFTVRVADKIVRAVGTEFNLQITDSQVVELIVTEGKVLVGVQATPAEPMAPLPTGDPQNGITLEAGERVVLGSEEESVEQINAEEIEVTLSWRGGDLIFRGEALEDAIDEIERYTQVEFIIQDENLRKIRVAGLFKAGDVEGLLTTLERNFNIASRWEGDAEIVLTAN